MSTAEEQNLKKILTYPLRDHPMLPMPTQEQRRQMVENVGVEETMRLFLMREQRIQLEQEDPHRYGTELPAWADADDLLNRHPELLILGGNRASKTEYAAKRIAQAFLGVDLTGNAPGWIKEKYNRRGINIWCLHQSSMTSIAMQQNVLNKYLPPDLKATKRGKHTQVSWTQKNGFSDNTAVYNGNQIWFLNYSQDIKVVEGGEVDYVWCDELVPADWLETLRYRLVTRNGKLLVTFTPIQGYTQVVKEFISTARIKTWKESELLPNANVLGVPKGLSLIHI